MLKYDISSCVGGRRCLGELEAARSGVSTVSSPTFTWTSIKSDLHIDQHKIFFCRTKKELSRLVVSAFLFSKILLWLNSKAYLLTLTDTCFNILWHSPCKKNNLNTKTANRRWIIKKDNFKHPSNTQIIQNYIQKLIIYGWLTFDLNLLTTFLSRMTWKQPSVQHQAKR